jgi:hypothetical protein
MREFLRITDVVLNIPKQRSHMQANGRPLRGLGTIAAVAVLLSLSLGYDATAQEAKKQPASKVASACKGLEEKACKGKTGECLWIAPKKGKQKPYCRLKTATKKKT